MNHHRNLHSLLLLFPLALAPVACKSKTSAEGSTNAPSTNTTAKTPSDDSSGVRVDDTLAKMCDLPRASFEFDSATLTDDDREILDALAMCFVSGAAKEERMRLTGHADPRGTDEYNLALGQRRADSVASYLHGKGLSTARTETSSRGELDAVGEDDDGWASDRRVDIALAR